MIVLHIGLISVIHQYKLTIGVHMSPFSSPTPVFLLGKFHGQRSLVGYCPGGRKSWIRLSTHA